MASEDPTGHWNRIFDEKGATAVTWYQEQLRSSLELIDTCGLVSDAPVIDVGGGASTLVDDLLQRGYSDVSVLDLSDRALALSRKRLGPAAEQVHWLVGDINQTELPQAHFGLWHDRAVFHFLVEDEGQARYVEQASQAIRDGGDLIIATFSMEGPNHCSGLPTMQYDAKTLASRFSGVFELIESRLESHHTPRNTTQSFLFCHLRRHPR